MPLTVNLRHLEAHNVRLEGELQAKELDIDTRDEIIRVTEPLQYDLEAQELDQSLLIQGRLSLVLECRCVRCLKPFQYLLRLEDWACHLPLQGEERVAVINDQADLTPYVREDILLAFPQHPLCEPECRGLLERSVGRSKQGEKTAKTEVGSPAWAELNKLKF